MRYWGAGWRHYALTFMQAGAPPLTHMLHMLGKMYCRVVEYMSEWVERKGCIGCIGKESVQVKSAY